MVLDVLKFPDPRLRRKANSVSAVTPELKALAQDMLETMYEFKGIGLAATQVGKEIRLLVMDTRPKENGRYKVEDLTELEKQVVQPIVIFNPEIKVKEGETTFDEGCLSVPGYFETVSRYNYVEVHGLDLQGEPLVLKADGLLSICLQHEMDHLDGKLFIDRLSIIRANRLKNKIKKNGYPKPEELLNHEDAP
jgi:peptide deformylase